MALLGAVGGGACAEGLGEPRGAVVAVGNVVPCYDQRVRSAANSSQESLPICVFRLLPPPDPEFLIKEA